MTQDGTPRQNGGGQSGDSTDAVHGRADSELNAAQGPLGGDDDRGQQGDSSAIDAAASSMRELAVARERADQDSLPQQTSRGRRGMTDRSPGDTHSAISGNSVRVGDRVFKALAAGSGAFLLVVMAAIATFLVWKAWPALTAPSPGGGVKSTLTNKGNLFTTQTWQFSSEGPANFGVAALVFGTVVSALIAMIVGVPIAIGIALYISQYAPRRLASLLGGLVDLLAAVPSLIFGMWGLYLLLPQTAGFQKWLTDYFSWIPIFSNSRFTQASQYGQSLLMAGIVLAIMILPVVSAVCREVFLQTPREAIDAAWALGATKWEVIRSAVLPFGRAGVISAAMLGLGRALGETIAVALVLSSSFKISLELTSKAGDTLASTIALKFGEASGTPLGIPALITAGLFLFLITLIVNSIARAIVARKKEFTV